MRNPTESATSLVNAARRLYPVTDDVHAQLDALEARLTEPLRVALVGSVKAGKSTLLNGLIGERIAPTDARECTRVVTRYEHGRVPRVTAHLPHGEIVSIPARRQSDRLELDVAGLRPEDVRQIDVTWPAEGIAGITLIDTPGTASVTQEVSRCTDQFLLPEEGAAGADAVVYLLRSLHETDVRYLRLLKERTRHGNAAIGAIAVLSRADELGSARLDAQVAINETANRLRNSPELEGICETVVPVAGLLGLGAITMKQADYTTFVRLAALPAAKTDAVLLTAERFITARSTELPAERERNDLIERFGLYGIRLALAAVRGGIEDAGALSAELLRRSGLDELRRVIDVHFTGRQAELKAQSVVFALHQLLRHHPAEGTEELLASADQHMATSHTYAEMQLIGRISSGRLDLPGPLTEELERLVGGSGASAACRLNRDADATGPELKLAAVDHLLRWRELRENPLLDRSTSMACAIAEQSCVRLIAGLEENAEGAFA
ncbi:dynamin family protein [Leucobacter albus]|uniref:Dynamin family protein n=1 Tax=Leucobacter albus TaxID=272210 RepID=A0ABW3TMN5_9MICO